MSRVRQGFIILLVVSCLSLYVFRSTYFILDVKQEPVTFFTWTPSWQPSAKYDVDIDVAVTPTALATSSKKSIKVKDTTIRKYVEGTIPTTTPAETDDIFSANARKLNLHKMHDFNMNHIYRLRDSWKNEISNFEPLAYELRTKYLNTIESNLEKEMNSLLPNDTTSDRLILLLTSWRSGSTFTAELLASHPGVFYHYEPLLQYGFKDLANNSVLKDKAAQTVSNLFNCDYADLFTYLSYASHNEDMFSRNRRLWSVCKSARKRMCYDTMFITQACHAFPHQLMKTVRLRLDQVEFLFKDPDIGPKLYVILLVRDPRGVMNSRKGVKWCLTSVCSKPSHFCNTYETNYKTAISIKEKYPKQLMVLRYEDVARQPVNKTHELFEFLGFPVTNATENYLIKHTTENMEEPWSTLRKSETRVEMWKSKLDFEEIVSIQKVCTEMMDYFGYRLYNTSQELEKDSVLQFNFTVN